MTDVTDRASEEEDRARADALYEQERRAGLRGKTVSDSATHCRVCDEKIPRERRRFVPGVQTCVACQAALEGAEKRRVTR